MKGWGEEPLAPKSAPLPSFPPPSSPPTLKDLFRTREKE